MGDGPISVVVADDTMLVRQGIVRVLESTARIEVVADVDDQPSLLAAVERHAPDVVLTDIAMPPTNTDEGIVAAITIRQRWPEMGVVVLSQYAEPTYVNDLFADGTQSLGYLLKERVGDPAELERAIAAVADGGSMVDPKIVEILVSARRGPNGGLDRLTPRETEVLAAMAEGLNNNGIGERLVLSERAVAKHINSMFSKLDLGDDDDSHRRVKAVLTWLAR
jgi:DNA-binding NarL/FixJ family response regulator